MSMLGFKSVQGWLSIWGLLLSLLWLPQIVFAEGKAFHDPQNQLNLEQYRGKVVLIDFWASWCIPCRRAFPWLETISKRYKDKDLVVIGVNLDDSKESMDRFLEKYPVTFVIQHDPRAALAEANQLQGMPVSFLINRKGEVVYRHVGFRDDQTDSYENEIKRHLN